MTRTRTRGRGTPRTPGNPRPQSPAATSTTGPEPLVSAAELGSLARQLKGEGLAVPHNATRSVANFEVWYKQEYGRAGWTELMAQGKRPLDPAGDDTSAPGDRPPVQEVQVQPVPPSGTLPPLGGEVEEAPTEVEEGENLPENGQDPEAAVGNDQAPPPPISSESVEEIVERVLQEFLKGGGSQVNQSSQGGFLEEGGASSAPAPFLGNQPQPNGADQLLQLLGSLMPAPTEQVPNRVDLEAVMAAWMKSDQKTLDEYLSTLREMGGADPAIAAFLAVLADKARAAAAGQERNTIGSFTLNGSAPQMDTLRNAKDSMFLLLDCVLADMSARDLLTLQAHGPDVVNTFMALVDQARTVMLQTRRTYFVIMSLCNTEVLRFQALYALKRMWANVLGSLQPELRAAPSVLSGVSTQARAYFRQNNSSFRSGNNGGGRGSYRRHNNNNNNTGQQSRGSSTAGQQFRGNTNNRRHNNNNNNNQGGGSSSSRGEQASSGF